MAWSPKLTLFIAKVFSGFSYVLKYDKVFIIDYSDFLIILEIKYFNNKSNFSHQTLNILIIITYVIHC